MKSWSLAARIFAGQLIFLTVLTAVVATVLFLDARDQNYSRAEQRMRSVAVTIAASPFVLEAVQSPDPTSALQPYARDIMHDASVDFITIMAPDGTRFTHPDPGEIGRTYIGSTEQALRGEIWTETVAGTLGPSVRAIVPIQDEDGTVHGMVATGVTVTNVSVAIAARLPFVILTAVAVMAASSVASWLLSRYLNRATLGWGPEQLSRIFIFYDSVLHSVREGVVLVDPGGQLVLYNDQAARLLNLPPRPPGGPALDIAALKIPEPLKELLLSGRVAREEVLVTDDQVLVVSQDPAVRPPQRTRTAGAAAGSRAAKPAAPLGTVATLRDRTEVQSLAGELESMRTLTDALRAQTHEHSNRLHTIVSLIELGRDSDAIEFAARDLQQSQQLTDKVVSAVDEPFISALLVGKAAQANERGIELNITADTAFGAETVPAGARAGLDPAALVTIVGNLLDNAFDAVSGAEHREVSIDFLSTSEELWIEVHDSGPGIPESELENIFSLGFSSKADGGRRRGVGLALVRQAVRRLGGQLTVDNEEGAVFTVSLPLHPARPATGEETGGTNA